MGSDPAVVRAVPEAEHEACCPVCRAYVEDIHADIRSLREFVAGFQTALDEQGPMGLLKGALFG